MSIVRVGSTQKFSEGWDKIFAGKKAKSADRKPGSKKKAKAKAVKAGKKK